MPDLVIYLTKEEEARLAAWRERAESERSISRICAEALMRVISKWERETEDQPPKAA